MYASFSFNGSDQHSPFFSTNYAPLDDSQDVETLYHNRLEEYKVNLKDERVVDHMLNNIKNAKLDANDIDRIIRNRQSALIQKMEFEEKVIEIESKRTTLESKFKKFNKLLKIRGSELLDKEKETKEFLDNINKNYNDFFQMYCYEIQKETNPINSQINNAKRIIHETDKFNDLVQSLVVEEVHKKIQDKDPLYCKVCYEKMVSHICLPCGHLYCEVCIKDIKICHICKQNVNKSQKFYIC